MPFKSEVSLSRCPVRLLKLSPAGLKAKCSGNSSSRCRTPSLESPMWGSELSLLCENLCIVIILQLVGCPPRGVEFDYISSLPLLPISLRFLLYVFSCRRSFLVGSSLFSLMVVLQRVVTLMCLPEEISSGSFYSTILATLCCGIVEL